MLKALEPYKWPIAIICVLAACLLSAWGARAFTVAQYEAKEATRRADNAETILTQVNAAVSEINFFAKKLPDIEAFMLPRFAELKGELKNAQALPVDCRPDAVRLHGLKSAVDTANAAATGRIASPAMQGTDSAR